jgi:hypothetical protein
MKLPARIIFLLILLPEISGMASLYAEKSLSDADIRNLWIECRIDRNLSFDIFRTAVNGYILTEGKRKKNIITIIDFSRPSTDKRCFVIDMNKRKLLYCCLVAHGKNSGENVPEHFSNRPESLESSLGFYLTAETYSGKHGYSLRLDGLEKSINDNARARDIVIHGADYVSQKYIDNHGRLGRSWGCPALPPDISKELIDSISNGSCIFIYGKDESYFLKSTYVSNKK